MEGQVAVRIKAKTKIAYGEELLVCGSVPQLGSWKLNDAALMQCQGEVWSLATRLPSGVRVELKLVQRPQGGQVLWHGAGPGGNANLVLETSIGRVGAQGSRFVSIEGFPWRLEVEDLDPEEAAGLQPENHPPESGGAPNAGAAPGPGTALATPGSIQSPMAEPVKVEALLAGHAAAAGHAVTYTTTTTTTTAVTINGAAPGGFAPSPVGPPIEYAPQVTTQQSPPNPSGAPPGNGAAPPPNRSEKALPPPEPTDEDKKAMVAARQLNTGIPRAGPLPLQWSSTSARDVRVRGSWDGWKRDVALEPSPGIGYRIMLLLPAGEYEFKFIVDGTWTTSDEIEQTKCNNRNNVATVNEMVLVPVPLTKVDAQAAGKLEAIEAGALAIEA